MALFLQSLRTFNIKFNNVSLVISRYKSSRTRQVVRLQSEKAQAKHFIDFKRIRITGGTGGDGCRSFLSLFADEFAGPDGGDGGYGGDIIFQADNNVTSLGRVQSLYFGENGRRGRSKHCTGRNAHHTEVSVPIGTFFRCEDGRVVADLQSQGDTFVAAKGGVGGRGNYYFLSNDNRAPMTCEEGAKGEAKVVYAELRIIAHVGMVGFPNAGKSSLLRAISRARPKVASYPFTTLYPHVGVIDYRDYEQVFVADVPGLLPGAHLNHGLGCSFLRHIERCNCLLYVVDLSCPDPSAQLDLLRYELEQYMPGLSQRPHIVVANKMDLSASIENFDKFRAHVGTDTPLLAISAKHKTNIAPLVDQIRNMYDKYVAVET